MTYEQNSNQKFPLKKTKGRTPIFNSAVELYSPLIESTSDSQAVDQAVKSGVKYLERMRDKKKELQEIDQEIEELQEKKKEIREKWETDQVKFEDL